MLCKIFWIPDPETLGNLYTHQMLAYVLAYLLVFRSTFSYNRFWEASNALSLVMSKLGAYHTAKNALCDARWHFCDPTCKSADSTLRLGCPPQAIS